MFLCSVSPDPIVFCVAVSKGNTWWNSLETLAKALLEAQSRRRIWSESTTVAVGHLRIRVSGGGLCCESADQYGNEWDSCTCRTEECAKQQPFIVCKIRATSCEVSFPWDPDRRQETPEPCCKSSSTCWSHASPTTLIRWGGWRWGAVQPHSSPTIHTYTHYRQRSLTSKGGWKKTLNHLVCELHSVSWACWTQKLPLTTLMHIFFWVGAVWGWVDTAFEAVGQLTRAFAIWLHWLHFSGYKISINRPEIGFSGHKCCPSTSHTSSPQANKLSSLWKEPRTSHRVRPKSLKSETTPWTMQTKNQFSMNWAANLLDVVKPNSCCRACT